MQLGTVSALDREGCLEFKPSHGAGLQNACTFACTKGESATKVHLKSFRDRKPDSLVTAACHCDRHHKVEQCSHMAYRDLKSSFDLCACINTMH